jgi:hypothetical protein
MTDTPDFPRRRTRTGTRGQSMVEYLVASAIVLALIAVPIAGNDSALSFILEAVRAAYQKFLAAASLPH